MKRWLIQKLKDNEKIFSTALTIPIIAAGTMSGACAAGCPYGLVNDPYPGQCPRYIDVTGDGICDLSQAATAASTSSATGTTNADTNNSATGTDDISINEAGPDSSLNQNDNVNASAVDSGSGLNNFGEGGGYHVLPISILLIGGYLFTHMLFSRGILSQQKHRRLWNLLVTGGYIGTGITGILLTFMVNLGVHSILNPSITFWHAELSVLMVIGTLIHIHLYKKPFKKMFKVLFGFGKSNANKKSENANKSK